jgi:GGDEF domain-containing protein
MLRPAATGLATAFFRLYILDTLSNGPGRPASLLARVSAERLPFATGAFARALQSLLEGGHLTPAPEGMVALTILGAAERLAERERWTAVVPSVMRLLGDVAPRPEPIVAESIAPAYRARVADAYADRVLVARVRERVAAAREGGRPFCVVLLAIVIEHANESSRRAMVHRAIRASLGGASTLFGGDVNAYRYGDDGVALVAPCAGDAERLATPARARIDELVHSMTSNVRAFHGARWRVSAGAALWSAELNTTGTLLRAAEQALRNDVEVLSAAS